LKNSSGSPTRDLPIHSRAMMLDGPIAIAARASR
jgi:hypothetical protein